MLPTVRSSLVDVSPGDGIGVDTATLRAGQSWTSPDGIRISVGTVTATGAAVTVADSATPATPPGLVTALKVTGTTPPAARPSAGRRP